MFKEIEVLNQHILFLADTKTKILEKVENLCVKHHENTIFAFENFKSFLDFNGSDFISTEKVPEPVIVKEKPVKQKKKPEVSLLDYK